MLSHNADGLSKVVTRLSHFIAECQAEQAKIEAQDLLCCIYPSRMACSASMVEMYEQHWKPMGGFLE
jgi:hypothetical protein